MNELTFGGIITNSFKLGFRYFGPILGALILYILTIWIPYLNVGTTIAIIAIIPAMAKGEKLSPTGIFQRKYRENFGDFFLLLAFITIGSLLGYLFLVIPGMVLSIAWCLAIYLFIDRDMSPLKAIKTSNRLTYGKKWTIFFGILVLAIMLGVIVTAVTFIGGMMGDTIGAILSILVNLIILPVYFGAYAHIYQKLTVDMEPSAS